MLGYIGAENREYIVQRGQIERGRITKCASVVQIAKGRFAHPK